MFKQILVPLDGSTRAEQALPVAMLLVRASGGSIVLVRVAKLPVDSGGGFTQAPLLTEQIIETELENVDDYLKTVGRDHAVSKLHVDDKRSHSSVQAGFIIGINF